MLIPEMDGRFSTSQNPQSVTYSEEPRTSKKGYRKSLQGCSKGPVKEGSKRKT